MQILQPSIPLVAATSAVALLLVACGGADDALLGSAHAVPTLVADDGSVMPNDPAAAPLDPSLRTASGRYATREQADTLRRLGKGTLFVSVAPGDAESELARRVRDDPRAQAGTLVLVEGDNLAAAARVADLLSAAGLEPLWLVTR